MNFIFMYINNNFAYVNLKHNTTQHSRIPIQLYLIEVIAYLPEKSYATVINLKWLPSVATPQSVECAAKAVDG